VSAAAEASVPAKFNPLPVNVDPAPNDAGEPQAPAEPERAATG
jgi:hypothetical protein